MKAYIRIANNISKKTGNLVSWFTLLLVLVVCYDVFTRYLLKESSVALQELEWHIFAFLFMITAAFTLQEEGHVRVDIIYSNLSDKKKAWINFLGTIIFLIPFCLLVVFASNDFVISSFKIKEISPNPGGLPGRYIIKAVIPVSFILLLIQGVSLMFKSFLIIKGKYSDN